MWFVSSPTLETGADPVWLTLGQLQIGAPGELQYLQRRKIRSIHLEFSMRPFLGRLDRPLPNKGSRQCRETCLEAVK